MRKACENSFSGCLMRLYDKSKNTLTVFNFLKALQKEPDIFFKEDINRLKNNYNIVEVLNKLRNKKYFHNSIEIATHHSVVDPLTQRPYELKIEEIKDLVEMSLCITKNYQGLFGKNIDNFLMRIDSLEDIFLLLEHHCFSTKPTVY